MFLHEIKQFVPSLICLSCDGCCRFRRDGTCWQPKMATEEIDRQPGAQDADQRVLRQKIDADGRLATVAYHGIFICSFFNPPHNTCGVYHARPFECRLYPFLLMAESGRARLGVHLLCPYVQKKKDTLVWEEYLVEVKRFFARDDVRAFLKRQPFLFGDYGESRDQIEIIAGIDLGVLATKETP